MKLGFLIDLFMDESRSTLGRFDVLIDGTAPQYNCSEEVQASFSPWDTGSLVLILTRIVKAKC